MTSQDWTAVPIADPVEDILPESAEIPIADPVTITHDECVSEEDKLPDSINIENSNSKKFYKFIDESPITKNFAEIITMIILVLMCIATFMIQS